MINSPQAAGTPNDGSTAVVQSDAPSFQFSIEKETLREAFLKQLSTRHYQVPNDSNSDEQFEIQIALADLNDLYSKLSRNTILNKHASQQEKADYVLERYLPYHAKRVMSEFQQRAHAGLERVQRTFTAYGKKFSTSHWITQSIWPKQSGESQPRKTTDSSAVSQILETIPKNGPPEFSCSKLYSEHFEHHIKLEASAVLYKEQLEAKYDTVPSLNDQTSEERYCFNYVFCITLLRTLPHTPGDLKFQADEQNFTHEQSRDIFNRRAQHLYEKGLLPSQFFEGFPLLESITVPPESTTASSIGAPGEIEMFGPASQTVSGAAAPSKEQLAYQEKLQKTFHQQIQILYKITEYTKTRSDTSDTGSSNILGAKNQSGSKFGVLLTGSLGNLYDSIEESTYANQFLDYKGTASTTEQPSVREMYKEAGGRSTLLSNFLAWINAKVLAWYGLSANKDPGSADTPVVASPVAA